VKGVDLAEEGPPMSQSRRTLALIACLTAAFVAPSALRAQRGAEADRPARTDVSGDPLPEGALLRLGNVRWRHEEPGLSVSFSPDGRRIRSYAGGTLFFWDSAGRVQRKVGGGRAVDRSMALSGDGKTLAAVGENGPIRLWDVASGKELPALGKEDE